MNPQTPADTIHSHNPHGEDLFAAFVLDAFVLLGSSSTLAYYITLFTRLPAFTWYPLHTVCLAAGGAYFRRLGGLATPKISFQTPLVTLILLCLAAASVNIITLRPDADDFSYLHRALHAANHMAQPFIMEHTSHELADLPPISPVHLLSSVEVGAALIARLLGLPIIFFTHQVLGTLVLLLTPLAYYSLFRTLDCDVWPALLGTIAALVFLAISGDSHQDWGNFTIVRAWQGKCILVVLLLPFLAGVVVRFMYLGQKGDLARLFALMVLGIGLTSSGFFVVPYAFGLLSALICLAGGLCPRLLRRFLAVCSTLVIPGVLAIAATSPLFHQLTDMTVWVGAQPRSPVEWLSIVVPTWTDVIIYCAIWVYCILATARKSPQRAFLLYSLTATLILLLPGISTSLMELTKPGVYWRLAYASLEPAIAGLAVAVSSGARNRKWEKISFCAACFLFMVLTKTFAVNTNVLTLPHWVKFPAQIDKASDDIASTLPNGAVVAAPESIVWVLGLRRHDLRFISTRHLETVHVFRNYWNQNEATQRIEVSNFLNDNASPDAGTIRPYLAGLDAIILPRSRDPAVLDSVLSKSAGCWKRETIAQDWNIWRKCSALQSD
jgi:hypothetical protein